MPENLETEKIVLATVKPQIIGEFAPSPRLGETQTEVLVRIGNRTWPLGLAYPWDYKHGYGDDRKRVVEVKSRDIDNSLSELGIVVDWTDVMVAFEAWIVKHLAEKEAAEKVKRAADWDASWVHKFVAEAGTPEGFAFKIPPKEKYVAECGHNHMNVVISYRGMTRSVIYEKERGWGNVFRYRIYELRGSRRYTKVSSVLKTIKDDIDEVIATQAARNAAAITKAAQFKKIKEMFPDETIEQTSGNGYRIELEKGRYSHLSFDYHPAGTYRDTDRFSVRGIENAVTFEEFVTILTIAKNAYRRYRSNS